MFKKNNNVILKTLLISILMICLSSFFFAIHDTLLKYISSGKLGNIKWYHHISIGGPFGITMILFFSFFYGGIKKNIILDSYKIPVLRGILSIANFLMAFIALKYISLSIFTTLILTLPFFLVIFSYLILKETISRTIIFSLFVGFLGVVGCVALFRDAFKGLHTTKLEVAGAVPVNDRHRVRGRVVVDRQGVL